MCRSGNLCSPTIYELKWYYETYFAFNKYCPSCDLKIAVNHIGISIKLRSPNSELSNNTGHTAFFFLQLLWLFHRHLLTLILFDNWGWLPIATRENKNANLFLLWLSNGWRTSFVLKIKPSQEIVSGGRQNCKVKARQSKRRWCHYFIDFILYDQHLLHND